MKSERDCPAPARKAMPQESHKIADWLFAASRFAVTQKQRDRTSVMIVARQMGRLGARFGMTQFGFLAGKVPSSAMRLPARTNQKGSPICVGK